MSNSNKPFRLSSIPARLKPTKYSRAEPSPLLSAPLSASSFGSSVEDYIGSGTDTVGGRTPIFDKRLSFVQEDDERSDISRLRSPRRFDIIDSEFGSEDEDDMADNAKRPSFLRPTDGRSGTPLLKKDDDHDRGRTRYNNSRPSSPLPIPAVVEPGAAGAALSSTPSRPAFSRQSTMRSRSPDTQARMAARKKYTYAAIFLVVSLVSFTAQAELGRYVQHDLGWDKAYCMLYLTHGSWAVLWPAQLLILRVQSWSVPWPTFWRRHVYILRSTAHMVARQELDVPRHVLQRSPVPYIVRNTAFITTALTIAGLSWYVAVNMTSPSDLTAIYNCSAFFAYAFSVPLLKEKLRLDKSFAVLVAIAGVMVVAYGGGSDAEGGNEGDNPEAGTRFLGNLIIGAGSVLYGLYEVLYKRLACPPEGTTAARGMIFANAFGSCIGFFTLFVLWIPIPLLHILGWETFELPTGRAAVYLFASVMMNALFAGSFLVLISLTSPVLSSVAALLTIFIVALADWMITGETMSSASVTGGCMIVVAFLMLSWSTWREMSEDAEHKATTDYAPPVDWSSDDSDKDGDRLD